jgi:hypothetical protein
MQVLSKILDEEHAENVTEVVCWNVLKFKHALVIPGGDKEVFPSLHSSSGREEAQIRIKK